MPKHPRRVDLSVRLGKLSLRNPIILASGTFGRSVTEVLDLDKLGGVVTKTVTLKPRRGNPPPRIVETPSGLLNSIGLENNGLDYFIKEELPLLRRFNTRLIVSIAGQRDQYATIAQRLNDCRGIDALELNLSCPNIDRGGLDYGTKAAEVERIVQITRRVSRFPLIVKLTPNVTDICKIARGAINGGADILSLINTLKALAVDWRKRGPVLGGITGGLSGPAIKPLALRMVWEVASRFRIPIMGIGGIFNAEDVLEFICVGASAVQIGTANLVDCLTPIRILQTLPKLLLSEGIYRLRDLIHSFQS